MTDELPRPANDDDRDAWRTYWTAQGMPWRIEPEIDDARQAYLVGRRAVTPNVERGIYPFRDEKGSIKLTRADIEWLLATHESAGTRGPVDWNGEKQREREGLDLRGADLREMDLSRLPLARLRGCITRKASPAANPSQRAAASINLEGALLIGTQLQGAQLRDVHVERAYLRGAQLAGADLTAAHLEGASLFDAVLCDVEHPDSDHATAATKGRVHPRRRHCARMPPADLHFAYFDAASSLTNALLGDGTEGVRVGDIRWNGVNLGRTDWRRVRILGDELVARYPFTSDRDPTTLQLKRKDRARRLYDLQAAVRAYQQLALTLRGQGINEHADRFAYRAQVLQRHVLRRQRKPGQWVISLLLWALAGYGYRLWRILSAYMLALVVFAGAYFAFGVASQQHVSTAQALVDAFQVSLMAIHGRVFFEQFGLGSTLAWVAAVESVAGIIIEGVFVAMLVQRFFAR